MIIALKLAVLFALACLLISTVFEAWEFPDEW